MKSFVVLALLGSAMAFPAPFKKPSGAVAFPTGTGVHHFPSGAPHPTGARPSGAKGSGRPHPSGVHPSGAKGRGYAHPSGVRPSFTGKPGAKPTGANLHILPFDHKEKEEEEKRIEINYGIAARAEESSTIPKPTKTKASGFAKATGVKPTGAHGTGKPHHGHKPHGTGKPSKPHGTGKPSKPHGTGKVAAFAFATGRPSGAPHPSDRPHGTEHHFGGPRPTGVRPFGAPHPTGKATKPFFPEWSE